MNLMHAITLGYHDVTDPAAVDRDAISHTRRHYALDLEHFRAHLEAVKNSEAHIANVASPASWGEQPVFLTFDDGAECALTIVADELEGHGWRGHFFVTTNWVGRPGFLSAQQIRQLSDRGHAIGSHSCSHPARMSHLSDKELAYEWQQSRARLSEILGREVLLASVPDGYFSGRVAQAAAEAGIRFLFTSEPTATVCRLNGCLIVGRYFLHRDSPAELAGDIAAGRRWPRWQQSIRWGLKKPIKAAGGDLYLTLRSQLLARNP